MRVLVTGSAGFIGFHLCKYLLKKEYSVYGLDNLNNYYDLNLKKNRLKILKTFKNFKFIKVDLSQKKKLYSKLKNQNFDVVINLAAQAGVRYSLKHPEEYLKSNLIGFCNLIN